MKDDRINRNKLIVATRRRLCEFIKSKNTKKTNSTLELLGCTPEFLRNYIEEKFTPEMVWENHGTYWHLDHIYPLSKVDVNDETEFKKACHYSNLQPLSVLENLRKGNKIPTDFVWGYKYPE